MPAPKDLAAHEDRLDLWRQAAASPRGIAIRCDSPTEAKALQLRLQYARQAERRQNAKIFPADHPQHGKSYYENFMARVREATVEIIPLAEQSYQVEEL